MCETVAEAVASNVPLGSLVKDHTAQMSLVGLQVMWTASVESAMERAKVQKTAMADATKQALLALAELSSWCLGDLGSDMNRTKLETLVTVQVHQLDVLGDVVKLFKDKKIQVGYQTFFV